MSKRAQRRHNAKARKPAAPPDWRSELSGPLFHYTSGAGLIGIIQNQVLWATHASFLNDTAELKILSTLLAPQIADEFREVVPKLEALDVFKSEMLRRHGEGIYDTEAGNLCRAVMRAIENVSPMYVVSFCMHDAGSEESKHGLLSQWRGYGFGGFAIEFDPEELDRLCIEERTKRSLQMVATRKVAYHDHAARAQLDRFHGIGRSTLGTTVREVAPEIAKRAEIKEILGDKRLDNFIRPFLETVPFLKTPRFEAEREYRLVAAPTRLRKAVDDKRQTVEVYFREGPSGTIVPYVKLFESLGEKLPIRKIIVGPHRDQENQLRAVELLLEQNKMDIEVATSDTTLRV